MGAVLVHIDLDGDHPHPASLAALAAGRLVASSWGATLYAAMVAHDASDRSADSTAQVVTAAQLPEIEDAQSVLARAGADKVVVAMTDLPLSTLWCSLGTAWQGVLDHLRPRLVLFGAGSPSAPELAPRTAARLGARLLARARAIGVEDVELRDRDGGYVRSSDSGAAVVMVGGPQPALVADDDADLVVLVIPGGGEDHIELVSSTAAEVADTSGVMIALGEDVAGDAAITQSARQLAALLGAPIVGNAAAARSGAITPGGVLERGSPLAPEVMIAIGTVNLDLAGATSTIKITPTPSKQVDGALSGPIDKSLAELVDALRGGS